MANAEVAACILMHELKTSRGPAANILGLYPIPHFAASVAAAAGDRAPAEERTLLQGQLPDNGVHCDARHAGIQPHLPRRAGAACHGLDLSLCRAAKPHCHRRQDIQVPS